MNQIEWSDFEKVELRVGRVISAEVLVEARKPAYKLHINFGSEIGMPKSSTVVLLLST